MCSGSGGLVADALMVAGLGLGLWVLSTLGCHQTLGF